MSPLQEELIARKKKLETVIKMARKDLANCPEGKLWVSTTHKAVQYYHHIIENDRVIHRYLPRDQAELKQSLAQKEYLMQLLKLAERELHDIDSLLSRNSLMRMESLYSEIHPDKKKFVKPLVTNDEEFADYWLRKPVESNPSFPEELKYPTKRGELTRSKSEAMLADMYYELGIPYKYDCGIALKDGAVKYVDFILLDKKKRKEIYHEHLGLLDDSGYRRDNMQKLDLYRRSGIYVGKNLILTHEGAGSPLNIRDIRASVKEMFAL
ncbi:MAG: hypothetical protein VZR13_06945 [Saccharofermentanaceae bacterium]|nr:hypothetical protein [Saccharofermentanaceae bacterium]